MAIRVTPITASDIPALRTLVRAVAKATGVTINVRKGTGSMRGTALLFAGRAHMNIEDPAPRIALLEALISAGYESGLCLSGSSTGLGSLLALSRDSEHALIEFSVAKAV